MSDLKFNGNKLAKIRKQKDLSQEKLSDLIGVTRQTIYLWESNQNLPDVEKVSKLCEVLNVQLSDLVDGMNVKEDLKEEKNFSLHGDKKINMKKIIGTMFIILFIIIIIYLGISFIKILRLKNIFSKWKELDKLDSYYINYYEFNTNQDGVITKESNHYEKYMKNKVLTTVFRDTETDEVLHILIDNFNTKERISVNENEKTYKKELLELKSPKLIDNIPCTLQLNYSNYNICFNPRFNIRKNGDYIIEIDSLTANFNKNTGLVYYEEYMNKDPKTQNFIKQFTIETNTNKTFDIDLNNYIVVE